MRPIRSILVAVRSPTGRTHPEITKAAQLSQATGARIELFHANSDPMHSDACIAPLPHLADIRREVQADIQSRMEHLANRLRGAGLQVSCSAVWDFPAAEAIIRHAVRVHADLIVAASHRGEHVATGLLRYTDWELLRQSPLPVLLVRRPRRYNAPGVLAALDPGHAFEKPVRLDDEILATAQAVCGSLHGELYTVHAYMPPVIRYRAGEARPAGLARHVEELARSKATKALSRTLRDADVPAANRYLYPQHAAEAIPAAARRMHASIVVMGAVSRSGFRRLFIGNTAERVLDTLECDVLVVKPRALAAQLTARVRNSLPRSTGSRNRKRNPLDR